MTQSSYPPAHILVYSNVIPQAIISSMCAHDALQATITAVIRAPTLTSCNHPVMLVFDNVGEYGCKLYT